MYKIKEFLVVACLVMLFITFFYLNKVLINAANEETISNYEDSQMICLSVKTKDIEDMNLENESLTKE